MTQEEKRAWLSRFRDGHKQMMRLKEQRARAVSFGEKRTVSFGGMPGSGRVDRVQLSVERVEQIDEEIEQLRRNMPVWEKEAAAAISSITNPDYRRVMQYYYVECLSWADTADLAGYHKRYLRFIQEKIMEELEIPPPTSP